MIAIITIAFCFSAFGNGANDVANSYATSVAARTLTMVQVGPLAFVTEFVGAVALGARVTGTIKNNIIGIDRFVDNPAVLILAMTCAEVGSAIWLMVATRLGLPVSTTRTLQVPKLYKSLTFTKKPLLGLSSVSVLHRRLRSSGNGLEAVLVKSQHPGLSLLSLQEPWRHSSSQL